MENLKKWFNFNNTISGTTFILRWVIALVVQFVGGFSLGYGLALDNVGFSALGLIIASAGIWLQFSSLIKRCRAIFPNPKEYYVFYIVYVLTSIIYGFVKGADIVLSSFVGLVMLVLFGITIFKDSANTEANHLG